MTPKAVRPKATTVAMALLVAGAALAFSIYLLGVVRIDATSTLWLNEGDVAQHFLGWHFFRGESWALPLGANRRYGMDMGSSIVFTDSIPLLAIAFKTLHFALPEYFQYAGGWMAFCFVAQGLCAFVLLKRFTDDPVVLTFGSLLFVFAPPLVARTMGHFALVGQWIILLALWVYFDHRSCEQRAWRWRLLLALGALVHGYLLYFTFAIWVAAAARDIYIERRATRSWILSNGVTFAWLLFVLWVAGWFMVPFGSAAFGGTYGQYAANLRALFNPPWGSPILSTVKDATNAGGLESINYLGAGVLLLSSIAIGCVARAPTIVWQTLVRHRFLALVCAAFAVLAFSHKMYWGETLLLHWPLPEFLRQKLELIRGSGRLLWLAHYLIILAALVTVVRTLPPLAAKFVVLTVFALQIYDLNPGFRNYRAYLADAAQSAITASNGAALSPFWTAAARRYGEINFYPITHSPPRYEALARLAGDHNIAINAAYFGRIPVKRAFEKNSQLERELTTGRRRANTLYVLLRQDDLARLQLSPDDGIGEIDGYLVVAPDWYLGVEPQSDHLGMRRFGSL
jgi:Family of unknown function (DUF6311)